MNDTADEELGWDDGTAPQPAAAPDAPIDAFIIDRRADERAAAGALMTEVAEQLGQRLRPLLGAALFHRAAALGNDGDAASPALPPRAVQAWIAIDGSARPAMLLVSPRAIALATATLFGARADGDAPDAALQRPRLTTIERLVLQEIAAAFAETLNAVLRDRAGPGARLAECGATAIPARWIDLSAGYAGFAFFSDEDEVHDRALALLLPEAGIAALLGGKRADAPTATLWRRQVREALAEIELPLVATFGSSRIAAAELARLRIGDTLPLATGARLALELVGCIVGEAEPGERDSRRAVRITHLDIQKATGSPR